MKVKLSHIGFNVSDMEKSIDFYVNGLGLQRAFSYKANGADWIEFIQTDPSHYIELFYEKEGKSYHYENGSFRHLSLECEDCIVYAEEIKSRGYEIWKEPVLGPDHNYQFWVKDPDGHPIEIIDTREHSPHKHNEKFNDFQEYDFDLSPYGK